MPVEVDCSFDAAGCVRVRRIRRGRPWQPVVQGRQWVDADGRHVLIMLDEVVHQLILRTDTLVWELRTLPGAAASVA